MLPLASTRRRTRAGRSRASEKWAIGCGRPSSKHAELLALQVASPAGPCRRRRWQTARPGRPGRRTTGPGPGRSRGGPGAAQRRIGATSSTGNRNLKTALPEERRDQECDPDHTRVGTPSAPLQGDEELDPGLGGGGQFANSTAASSVPASVPGATRTTCPPTCSGPPVPGSFSRSDTSLPSSQAVADLDECRRPGKGPSGSRGGLRFLP